MQTVSPTYAARTADYARVVAYKLEIKWGSSWSDETGWLDLNFDGKQAIAAPAEELVAPGDIGTVNLSMFNSDGRYDPDYEDSPLHEYISGETKLAGKDVRLSVAMGGLNEWVTIFTGVIAAWTPSANPPLVALTVKDVGWKFLQDKASTGMYLDILSSAWVNNLATWADVQYKAIETGLYRIPYAWLDDESYVEEIWKVQQSEGGMAYFDAIGRLITKNIVSLATNTEIRWTFDVDEWEDVSPQYNTEEIVSKVVCEWSSRIPAAEAILYTLDNVRTVLPGSHIDIEARFNNPAISIIDPVAKDAKDYYIASSAGVSLGDQIVVTVPDKFGQRATIRVTNNHPSLSAVIFKLQLRGYPIVGGPEEQVTVAGSTNPLNQNRVRSVRGNDYVQTNAQALALATVLAERKKKFVPVYGIRGVPGVPHLELTDRVQIETDTRMVTGWVSSITFRCQNGAFVQDIEVLSDNGFYDYDNYFRIGVTKLGGYGRAWH